MKTVLSYIGGLVTLIFVSSFSALWMQLANRCGCGYEAALNEAAALPKPVIVGMLLPVLIWGLILSTAAVMLSVVLCSSIPDRFARGLGLTVVRFLTGSPVGLACAATLVIALLLTSWALLILHAEANLGRFLWVVFAVSIAVGTWASLPNGHPSGTRYLVRQHLQVFTIVLGAVCYAGAQDLSLTIF